MIDIRQFFQMTNPSRTLDLSQADDQALYIDFSAVRGEEIIEELKSQISFFSPEDPTCLLFTGHIGCGKSTELLRLKSELEADGFFVVYFESSEDLELADVDISDVLLAIAKRVSNSLDQISLGEARRLKKLLQGAAKILMTEIELEGEAELSLPAGIGKITARAKSDVTLRDRLNQYLGPQKNQLLEAINTELLEPAIAQLKAQGKRGLVVIVDNLDRVDNRPKSFGRPQQEYLFIDQYECLVKLACHKVYTLPLALKFSGEYGLLTQRFPDEPKVLPMVPVQLPDGERCEAGLALLRQMIVARALPSGSAAERQAALGTMFDSPDSIDRLCLASGGHVRDLLRLLNDWIKKCRQFPLTLEKLEDVIRSRRNEMAITIDDDEWEMLRQVRSRKKVSGDRDYQTLIRSRLVFEYRNHGESWFDVNPILLAAPELNQKD